MTWKLDCGSYTLFVIEDGYYWRDPADYFEQATEHDWRFHPKNEQGQVRLNFGCYVVTNGDHTIMVDAGIGEVGREGMIAGLMPEAVNALDIARESVETVVYSHMHYDHIGGSQRDGKVVFPNARHVFHTNEWDHWRKVDTEFGKAAQAIMQPLLDADLVDFIAEDTEVIPGVTAVESFGHTPGHLTVSIMSNGTRTLIGGDVSNHPFQVEKPHWSLPVDNDKELAATTRDRVFEAIKDTDTTFVAGHYPMPGVGKIVTDDAVRVYQPGPVPQAATGTPDGTWVVTSYRVEDEMIGPTEDGPEAVLIIEDGAVSGSMGVNRLTGQLEEDMTPGPLAVTRMAGPPELMQQEQVLLEHLAEADTVEVDGDGMFLSKEGLTLVQLRKSGTE